MIDEFMGKLHELERDITDAFSIDIDMSEYLGKMKEENVVEISEEYISMAFNIASMYFKDAIQFVPVVLIVEVSRKINHRIGGCAECVVFWICDLQQQELMCLTHQQLIVIRQWLMLVASDGFVDDDIGKAIDIINCALGNGTENLGQSIHFE